MVLVKLIQLRKKEDMLKQRAKQWREVIYQNTSLQARHIASLQEQNQQEQASHQQRFFQRRIMHYLSGLKDTQMEIAKVRQEIQQYQNTTSVRVLKMIDLYGIAIILSVTIAGILSLWLN